MFCSQYGNNSFPRWEKIGTFLITDMRLLFVKTMDLFRNKRLQFMNISILFTKKPHPSRQGLETPLNKGFFDISSLP